MGKTYDHIPDNLIEWIRKQEAFWVATAPLTGSGHVNVSPKGLRGTFHVVGPNKVWYDDLSGSGECFIIVTDTTVQRFEPNMDPGCETIAHLRENGRITILFNAFEGPPQLVRLYGRGVAYEFGTPEYEALLPLSQRKPGSRSAIVVEVERVGTSCGWGVPIYKFEGQRKLALNYFAKIEKRDVEFEAEVHEDGTVAENGMKSLWRNYNLLSIDKLPALTSLPDTKLPLTSVMPDPIASAFRDPMEKRKVSQVQTAAKSRALVGEEELKMLLGVLIGSLLTSLLFLTLSGRSGGVIDACKYYYH